MGYKVPDGKMINYKGIIYRTGQEVPGMDEPKKVEKKKINDKQETEKE